jgi:hypothetical protein
MATSQLYSSREAVGMVLTAIYAGQTIAQDLALKAGK